MVMKSIQEVFKKYFNREITTIRFESNVYKFDICGKKELEILNWLYYDGCIGLDRKKILVHKKLNHYWSGTKKLPPNANTTEGVSEKCDKNLESLTANQR